MVTDVLRGRAAREPLVLLDCREAEERAMCTIEGSTWIAMGELPERLGELAGQEEGRIVVYCHLGGRSLRVAHWLRQQGFRHAQSMAGGINAWAVEIEPAMARY
jgi:adenylyltransferase/sulfurtransferase